MRWLRGVVVIVTLTGVTLAAESAPGRVHALKITILSTMLTEIKGVGEWGFSALVEVDGRRILFDTGARQRTVLENGKELGVDFSTIPEVVLSHSHWDHVGGLVTLRNAVLAKTPGALARVHAGEGIFYSRSELQTWAEDNPMAANRPDYEKTGGVFIVYDKPVQLYPGVWLTGPVPRKYPEKNWSGSSRVKTPAGIVEDNLPEDMAMVFDTDQGLVVLCGCGHARVINTLEYARGIVRETRIHALIGGLHLFAASDQTLAWTSGKLKSFGVDNLIGAHCTGIEPVYRFRRDIGLDRAHCVIGAVGASFELGKGIDPLHIAK